MNFLPEPALIAQFAFASVVVALTPGPDMTLFVSRAIAHGRAAGLACMAGAMTGIVIHTSLVALGLSALIAASPEAFMALKIVGAGYLVWLAVQALRHGSAFAPEAGTEGPRRPLMRDWATGLAINLMNPKIVLFFMTFLPQFVSASDPHAPEKLVFLGFFFMAIGLPVCASIVLAADRFARFVRGMPRLMRGIDYLFAAIFSAFAVRILTAAAR